MYENKTEYLILNNMLEKVTTPVAKTEGALLYDALSPVSCEIAKQYIELDAFIKRSFIQTTHSQFLDLRAMEYGLYRKQPTNAMVDVVFTGFDGTVIPQGFVVQTIDGKQFKTNREATINGTTTIVTAMAVVADTDYNLPTHTITVIPSPMAGLTSVTNNYAAIGGATVETDDDFKARILEAVRNPGASGNVSNYTQWAMSIDGVGAVMVRPLWNGNGTVQVCVLNMDLQPGTTELVEEVAERIETERPIGASVSVIPGVYHPIDISMTVVLNKTRIMADVTADIQKAIKDYFDSITYKISQVSYQKISAIILAVPGVGDHYGLTMEDDYTATTTANIVLLYSHIPQIRTLTIQEYPD